MKKKRKKERVYIEAPELHDENDGIRWRWQPKTSHFSGAFSIGIIALSRKFK